MLDTANAPQTAVINGVTYNAEAGQRPIHVDGCTTISALFEKRCKDLGDRTVHREKDLGIWKDYSWNDYWDHAKRIGMGLRKLGLKRGEVVSILSEDRKEWAYFDMGIQAVGGIASGIYTTDAAAQVKYLVNDSDSRFLVVENEEQLDKYLQIENDVPGLLKVIILEDEGLHDLEHPNCILISDLYEIGAKAAADEPGAFEEEIAKAQPQDTALLIYTSGTTGMPKGAMLCNENIMAAVEAGARRLQCLETDNQLRCKVIGFFPADFDKGTVHFLERTGHPVGINTEILQRHGLWADVPARQRIVRIGFHGQHRIAVMHDDQAAHGLADVTAAVMGHWLGHGLPRFPDYTPRSRSNHSA